MVLTKGRDGGLGSLVLGGRLGQLALELGRGLFVGGNQGIVRAARGFLDDGGITD